MRQRVIKRHYNSRLKEKCESQGTPSILNGFLIFIEMVEKILRERTNNMFTDKWYKETAKLISERKNEKKDPESNDVFDKIKRASNQYDGKWLPIYVIIQQTGLKIGNQKLGTLLTKNKFKSKILRFQSGKPVKCYFVNIKKA